MNCQSVVTRCPGLLLGSHSLPSILVHKCVVDSSFEVLFEVWMLHIDWQRLSVARDKSESESNARQLPHFLALYHIFPRRFGIRAETRSSTRNKPFSRNNCRRSSNPFHLPFSLEIPTTRPMNLILRDSSKFLYSLCGSLTIRHICVFRGSIVGCFSVLRMNVRDGTKC